MLLKSQFRTVSAGVVATLALAAACDGRITKITVESTLDPDTTLAASGLAGAIKRMSGRAHGELDPTIAANAIIQDITLAPKNAKGLVEYVTTFQLIMPSDASKMSGLMWHDVPNRGGRVTIVPAERNVGDVGLSSGWQGDNTGQTAHTAPGADFVIVPVPNTMFNASLAGSTLPPPNCPGNNFGTATLAPNVMPHIHTVNALREHFRNWVVKGTPPPASVWPRLAKNELVDATKSAMGFPDIPGLPPTVPSNFIMPTFDYDWGPQFNYNDTSGVPTKIPPTIKKVITMKVPRVNADGNEVGCVSVVLHDAPLGTYLGWNITADGSRPFHKGQICNYVGGMIPFAKTKAERDANNDPRPSLQERYTDHAGYVAAVKAAAANAMMQGFLLQTDADLLIGQADASAVLRP